MNNRKAKRHSAPSAAAGSASQAAQSQQQMMPWGPMGPAPPMYYAWPPQPGPMMGQHNVPAPTAAVKPWEVEVTDSDSDSDCFQPSQMKRKAGVSKKEAAPGNLTVKRGRGRPKKVDQDFAASLPKALEGYNGVAASPLNQCKNCRFYVGRCVLKPCGHALYCKKCVNDLREESIKLKRLSKCFNKGCFCLVSGWMALINVSA